MSFHETVTRGWPVVIEMGRVLPGPPNLVWRLITDWENLDLWMLEARDFVITSPHREGIGVEGETTVSIAGITTRDHAIVTRWEPERALAIKHEGWVGGEAEMWITELGPNRTHLFWREKLNPPLGILGGLGLTAFRPLMRRIFERDLAVLSALVRSETARA